VSRVISRRQPEDDDVFHAAEKKIEFLIIFDRVHRRIQQTRSQFFEICSSLWYSRQGIVLRELQESTAALMVEYGEVIESAALES
jgi:hypothetical protein